jgi:hypothetical protein
MSDRLSRLRTRQSESKTGPLTKDALRSKNRIASIKGTDCTNIGDATARD